MIARDTTILPWFKTRVKSSRQPLFSACWKKEITYRRERLQEKTSLTINASTYNFSHPRTVDFSRYPQGQQSLSSPRFPHGHQEKERLTYPDV